jgi:hypothetical protein
VQGCLLFLTGRGILIAVYGAGVEFIAENGGGPDVRLEAPSDQEIR